jgi:hypothetical protein
MSRLNMSKGGISMFTGTPIIDTMIGFIISAIYVIIGAGAFILGFYLVAGPAERLGLEL